MTMRKQQQGLTFFGLLVVGVLLALAGVVGAQVVPTYIEYLAVQKAVIKASSEGTTVAEVRGSFDKSAQIDDIKTISGKDLVVTKEGDRVVVSFAYDREIHLTGPAYLLMRYEGRSR